MITLTEAAKKQIDTLCDNNDCYGVSLNLKGGGCAGFEYDWRLVKTPADLDKHDEVFKTDNNCSFIVNASSIMFLVGTEVDYVTTIVGSNFEINNPNAQSSCGCGISVNFDMDNLVPQW